MPWCFVCEEHLKKVKDEIDGWSDDIHPDDIDESCDIEDCNKNARYEIYWDTLPLDANEPSTKFESLK